MRRFFLHIALFALPFLALFGYTWLKEQPREVAYNAIQKDCRTGEWIYKRLFESRLPRKTSTAHQTPQRTIR